MKFLIYCKILLLFCTFFSCKASKKYYVQGTNRVILHNNDTLKEFYAIKLAADELRKLLDPEEYYYWYDGKGIKITQGAASGRVLDGKYTCYYPDHNLQESGDFSKGLKNGKWKKWYAVGILESEQSWKKGLLHGVCLNYDSSGKISKRLNYYKGIQSGEQLYFGGDTISNRVMYKNGKIVVPKTNDKDSLTMNKIL